ncbi:MAG: PAS domain-containing protein [Planctomycetes bacterium]|nr:PAS domain-containing protein [Planctomycetota bacterium]
MEGRLQAMSENGQRMMGIDDFSVHQGIDWSGLWQGDDRVAALAAIAQAKADGLGEFQGFLPTMRGVAKWWDVHLAPVHGADGRIAQLIAVARDITDQRGIEKMLARQRLELERSNGELEHFAAIAAHDLKEPLRMVSSYLGLIERKYTALDAKMLDYIAHARDGAEQMALLLDGLLTYAHLASAELKPKAIEASRAFDEAVANLSLSIAERHAQVTSHGLPRINVNHEQMVQLLQNLIGNAIKFCRDRTPEVSITATSENQETTFRVTDNGIGIDAAQHEQIFSMFKRLNNRSEFSGSGIGLATCKRIVDRHGGRLWVESILGSGSTFCFTLASGEPVA